MNSIKQYKIWCKGTCEHLNFNKPKWIDPHSFLLHKYYHYFSDLLLDDDFVVCFHTGINDCFNNPIYENDIVKVRHGAIDRIGKVIFNRGSYLCEWQSGTSDFLSWMGNDKIEVIGNVFSNPELLISTNYPLNTDVNNLNEICVLCKCLTDYKRNTPIQFRNYYVEGSGQLCPQCYEKMYGGENDDPDNYPAEY